VVLAMSLEDVVGVGVDKLRGYLERLWSLAKSERLDRESA